MPGRTRSARGRYCLDVRRSRSTLLLSAAAAGGLLVPARAEAQNAGTPASAALRAAGKPDPRSANPGMSAGLRPVEANVGDTGALSTSPRELRVDLRQAAGFDRVYQLPWRMGTGGLGRPGDFVRFDSGVAAVFPRSQYVMTAYGPATAVPAGTTFYIGRLPESVLQSGNLPRAQSSLLRVDRGVRLSARGEQPTMSRPLQAVSTRVDRRVAAETGKPRTEPAPPATLMTDTKVREDWIDRLGSAAE